MKRWNKNDSASCSGTSDKRFIPPVKKKWNRRLLMPIDGVRTQIANAIRANPVAIIVGETGSGKSTQVPQICCEVGVIGERLLAITEPRRVAAITLARHVATEMNSNLGELVAYKVRFENTESADTKIVYATDGIILREAFYDSLLLRYSVVIVDEAHERSVHTDILLYILRLCYQQRMDTSNPLKVIIMSATLDSDLLSEYFNNAPIFMVKGRTHVVELFYANALDKKDDDYVFNVLTVVLQVHRNEPLSYDILAFLTGQEEIEAACKKIKEASDITGGGLMALPLYAGLSPLMQARAFEPLDIPNTRKVIFSTNIAETSLTIPGIRIVIDGGKVKVKNYLPERRIDVLRVENISQSSATQRAGRAGREAAGKCYRLYSEEHLKTLPKTTVPEILRSNLATVLLELYRIGMKNMKSLSLLSMPAKDFLNAAQLHLQLLGAFQLPSKKGHIRLSDVGTKLAAFPVDPAFGCVLISASENGCLEEALTVVAAVSADSIFTGSASERENSNNAKRKFEAFEGDHITMLNIFRCFQVARRERKSKEWCESNFVHHRVLTAIFKIRRQLREICVKNELIIQSCGMDKTKLRKSLCTGLFMNACEYDRSVDRYRLLMSPGTTLKIHPSSCLSRSRPTAFVFTDLVQTHELYARDISLIDLDWAKEIMESKKSLMRLV